MAIFNFNVTNANGFKVEKVSTIETDCSSVYLYKIKATASDSVRFSLSGNYENAIYTVLGVDTAIVGEVTVSYGSDLYISFSIINSGVSGTFLSAILTIDNDTSVVNYTSERTRLNDNTVCGLDGDKHYTHDQPTVSSSWTITHNLGKYCSVTAVDTAGTVWIGQVSYIDLNSLTIIFNASFSGSAYCN